MKRIFILIFAILLAGFAVLLYQQRSVDHWYGAFRIGDNTEISFISVGIDVFYDANSDGIPQGSEMVAPDGKVNIPSGAGGEEFALENVSVAIVPDAVSSNLPQLLDVNIQSTQNSSVWQMGTVTMSLNRESVETCHLLGPLSFSPFPQEFELIAGESNLIKISIGTCNTNDSPTTGALILTSPIGDRDKYAFDDAERPKLKIWYGDQTDPPEEIVFDGFC